ncbi:hypothetical protein [Rhodospira trueperi]|uniref:Magnetosome protein MamS/MamX domain-containing protein n=1 Tax=Rhodospira trueperi TaxID=69960 RepID=A0A1G7E214_9PROT|nr:hypothetical protein [Rhodospira trueperi]SDE57526.1 hypothetical protein SAMN05421720_108129 [Rhodospira trueperi]
MNRLIYALAALLMVVAVPSSVQAQKGLGDTQGVARQGLALPVIDLSGVVGEVVTERCAMTTGRAAIGAHITLQTPDNTTLNVHLGPVAALPDLLDTLRPGESVAVTAFRTEAMPADAYVARTVTVGDMHYALRDDTLRPNWQIGATGRGGQGMNQGGGRGPGRGGAGTGMGGRGGCWW